jgi:hypothetical protein
VNEGDEIKINIKERYSNVRKKDVNEEYQIKPNRNREGETE